MGDDLEITRRHLPHWRLEGSVYFITWRLLPGRPPLTNAEKGIVADCIKHFHNERYVVLAYVVMDDHVHLAVRPIGDFTLSKLTHTWKSYTAHQVNKLRGTKGSFWLDESFDRIIRNEHDLLEKLSYILTNPQRKWPGIAAYKWAEQLAAE